MPHTYMRTWPGSIGTKCSVGRSACCGCEASCSGGLLRTSGRVAHRGEKGFRHRVRTLQSIQYSGPPERRMQRSRHRRRALVSQRCNPGSSLTGLLAVQRCFGAAARGAAADELARGHATASRRPDRRGAASAPSARWPRKPKDAQMRFLKSVILADIGRTRRGAGAPRSSWCRTIPSCAEPHNNLAALYAAAGDYGKARAELEETIRLNPDYAPAHENLGDVLGAAGRPVVRAGAPARAVEHDLAAQARPGPPADAPSSAPRPAPATRARGGVAR